MKTSILEYLEESARKYPDKTAFADEHTSCTFKELEQTARRTGTALAKHFTPRNPVPVFMEKSVETIGVFMGALYAGCFYVLMDTKQPASRLQQILGILDSDVIVTSEKYLKDYSDSYNAAWKYFGQFFEERGVEYLNFNTQYFKAFTHDLKAYTDYDGHMNGDAAKEYSEVLAQVLESTGQKN